MKRGDGRQTLRNRLSKLRSNRDRLSPTGSIARRERFDQTKYDKACREYLEHVRKMYPPLPESRSA